MIRKLRRRMTVMMSGLTVRVLLIAMCITYSMAKTQYESNMQALMENNVAVMLDKLSSGEVISDKWLAEQEVKSLCIISILDNGTPLQFGGAWLSHTPRTVLLARSTDIVANDATLAQTLRTENRVQFSVNGDVKDRYHAYLAQLRQKNGQIVQLLVLQDLTAMTQHLRSLLLRYVLITLLGAAALAVIGAMLSYFATRPTALAIKQQNEFVAAASHELRSPLTVMKASMAAATEKNMPPEKAARFLQTAQQEADRMSRLLDDLLLLAGGDAKALSLQKSTISTDTFCIELYEKFHLLAKTRAHMLTLLLPDAPLPDILADKERLTQLFSVLLMNAMEYTPQNTPIEMVAFADKKSVKISVIDHGAGIADADKTQIFTRFYRADKSRTDKAHFGLGLSVAQEIAALHGSTLALSDTAGGGCTFTVTLAAVH